jgi:hypothetical protein
MRSWRNRIGPGEVSLTAKATIAEIGRMIGRNKKMHATSKRRFPDEQDHLLGISGTS